MTQPDLQRIFVKHCMDNGLEYERAYVIFGPAGLSLLNGSPAAGNVELKEGMFIRIDAQAKYGGYVCNLSRVNGHGELPKAMVDAQKLECQLILDLMPEMKPGAVVSDIRKKELELYRKVGHRPLVPYTGHGVGRVVHEPPYLALNDHTVLQPGMSVTLEPHILYSGDGDIFVGMEDHFLITSTGHEWLTESAPMGLYI
jgi:Xaa-Pro aminopeptidase